MKYKSYVHFDNKMTLEEAENYIKNLKGHQYLPFITYNEDKNKWGENHKKIKEYRTLSVSSIKDNYVYQYYNEILNDKYNEYIKQTKSNDSVCAYRKGLHKSNINTVSEVVDFLKKCDNAKIFVGDIHHFFDEIDHKILKENLKKVLNVEEIEENLYKMLKSLEKGVYIELDDIIKFLNKKGIYIPLYKEKYASVCNYCKYHNIQNIVKKEWFRELKEEYLKPSKEELKNKTKGIVQGSPVSGTLSNIYMINIDEKINELLSVYDYIYRRYCDDFIVIIKDIDEATYENIINKILKIIEDNKLEVKESKIQKYEYINKKIIGKRNFVQFLGFEIYNDEKIKIRKGTISRQTNKILKTKNIYLKVRDSKDDELAKKVFRATRYKKLNPYKLKDYRKYTFGNYIYNSNKYIKSEELKKTTKNIVNYIDKHIN